MQENLEIFEEDFTTQIGFRKTLTLQELEIAAIFLKRRFPQCSIETIVDRLNRQHQMKKNLGHIPLSFYQNATNKEPQPRSLQNEQIPRKNISRQAQPNKESAQQKKIREKQNLKLISTLFCQKGVDYDYAKTYIPDLTPSNYRSKLESIMNSVLKELINFLRKQCNVKLNDLSENQKITIKTALLSAHEWMGLKSTTAVETLFKFVCKIYVNRHQLITKQEAIQLYKVIVARVNDQSLDLLFIEPQNEFGDEIQERVRPSTKKTKAFSSQQQLLQLIAQTFLELFNPEKVSNKLLSKYSLDPRFQLSNINGYLRQIFELALAKLDRIQSSRLNYVYADQLIRKIMENAMLKVQYSLVQLYLAKKQDKPFERKLMQQLKEIQSQGGIKVQNNTPFFEDERQEPELESEIEESVDERQEYFGRISSQFDSKAEKKYQTNDIFEELFDVELPASGKSRIRQFNPRPQSSKREDQSDVIYFDE